MESINKKFLTSFVLPLCASPTGAKVAGVLLLGELLEDVVLAFGKCDIFFYYPRGDEQDYDVTLLSRTFCESMPIGEHQEWMQALSGRKNDLKVHVYFSKTPDVQTRLISPLAEFEVKGPFKEFASKRLYEVEVCLEGEICAQLVGVKEDVREPSRFLREEKVQKTEGQVTVDVDTLAEMVMKVIGQRGQEKSALPEVALPGAKKESPARVSFAGGMRTPEQAFSSPGHRRVRYVSHTDILHSQSQPFPKAGMPRTERDIPGKGTSV